MLTPCSIAAATSVIDESLSSSFSGILGLALPLNSIIAETIPPVTNNTPDGAAWASNLFSITPTSNAPASRFLSLSLSRPGSNRIPSLLGIGRHPQDLVQDTSFIHYYTTVSDAKGSLFWKTSVRDITVWVDGQPRPVSIGRSKTGAVFPSAVIDSGVPYIFTTTQVANAIYGAIDVHPAQDGNCESLIVGILYKADWFSIDYVPCRMPLNLSITLDNRPPFPVHPLDLTAEPPKVNDADFCIGMIQAADLQLTDPTSDVGDMILGVPFMRNVYTVMAYTVPTDDGMFPPVSDSKVNIFVQPRLGLMSLTDSTVALGEFNTVRVLNQPLSDGPVAADNDSQGGGKKLSTGVIVLIALLGFFAFCCAMFIVRSLLYRRQFHRRREKGHQADYKEELAYQLAHRIPGKCTSIPSEDTLRTMRYEEYMQRYSSFSSSKSRGTLDPLSDEFGSRLDEPNDNTLVPATHLPSSLPVVTTTSDQELYRHSRPPERYPHQRTPSEVPTLEEKTKSIATPFLSEDSHPHP